jgi:hypothetical protein
MDTEEAEQDQTGQTLHPRRQWTVLAATAEATAADANEAGRDLHSQRWENECK